MRLTDKKIIEIYNQNDPPEEMVNMSPSFIRALYALLDAQIAEDNKSVVELEAESEARKELINRLTDAGLKYKTLLNVYKEYTKLLTDELNEIAHMAAAHGWKSHRFSEGEMYRAKIQALQEKGQNDG